MGRPMRRAMKAAMWPAMCFVLCAAGCASPKTAIIVPPEAVREWAYTPDGRAGPDRYVVRMTDGDRQWEVEFPHTVWGSEVRVPLKGGGREVRLAGDRPGLT